MKVSDTDFMAGIDKYLRFVRAGEEITVTDTDGSGLVRVAPCKMTGGFLVREGVAELRYGERGCTYEEFLELTNDSDKRYELIDGVIYDLAAPLYHHEHTAKKLLIAFDRWFTEKKCEALSAPFDVTLTKSADNICVVQPDILVICDKDKIDEVGRYKGVPTLVVEILSGSSLYYDMIIKLNLYRQCGIKEYWLVDTKNKLIHVYRFDQTEESQKITYRAGENEYAESAWFEGLKVPLAGVFA